MWRLADGSFVVFLVVVGSFAAAGLCRSAGGVQVEPPRGRPVGLAGEERPGRRRAPADDRAAEERAGSSSGRRLGNGCGGCLFVVVGAEHLGGGVPRLRLCQPSIQPATTRRACSRVVCTAPGFVVASGSDVLGASLPRSPVIMPTGRALPARHARAVEPRRHNTEVGIIVDPRPASGCALVDTGIAQQPAECLGCGGAGQAGTGGGDEEVCCRRPWAHPVAARSIFGERGHG